MSTTDIRKERIWQHFAQKTLQTSWPRRPRVEGLRGTREELRNKILARLIEATEEAAAEAPKKSPLEKMWEALLTWHQVVETRPGKCHGLPVLRGTRFTVSQVLAELSAGRDVGWIAEKFHLDRAQMQQLLSAMAKFLGRAADESDHAGQEH